MKTTKVTVKKTQSLYLMEKTGFPRLMRYREPMTANTESTIRSNREAPRGDSQNSKSNVAISSLNFK